MGCLILQTKLLFNIRQMILGSKVQQNRGCQTRQILARIPRQPQLQQESTRPRRHKRQQPQARHPLLYHLLRRQRLVAMSETKIEYRIFPTAMGL